MRLVRDSMDLRESKQFDLSVMMILRDGKRPSNVPRNSFMTDNLDNSLGVSLLTQMEKELETSKDEEAPPLPTPRR